MAQQKSTLGSKSDFRLTTTGQCLHCTGSFSRKGTACHFEHIPPHRWEIKENSSPAQSQNSLGSFVECYTSSRQRYLHVSPAATHYEFLIFLRISHLYFTTIYVNAHNRAIFFVHKYKKDIKLYLNKYQNAILSDALHLWGIAAHPLFRSDILPPSSP